MIFYLYWWMDIVDYILYFDKYGFVCWLNFFVVGFFKIRFGKIYVYVYYLFVMIWEIGIVIFIIKFIINYK